MSTKRSRGAVVALGCGLAILWAFGRSPSSWLVKNAAPITRRVLFFGDSLVTGHGLDDPEASSIPAQVAAELGVDHEAYGVNGLTSVAALGELESLSLETDLVVVCLGGNDLLKRVPLERTLESLRTAFARLQESGCAVAYLAVSDPTSLSSRRGGRLAELCRASGVLYVPDILAGVFGDRALMSDRIHPNAEGCRRVARRVAAKLRGQLRFAAGD